MSFKFYYEKIKHLPMQEIIKRGNAFVRRNIEKKRRRAADKNICTYYQNVDVVLNPVALNIPAFKENEDEVLAVADLYLKHQFDLLGSGWCKVFYGMKCNGLEGYSYESDLAFNGNLQKLAEETLSIKNYLYAKKVISLIDKSYSPIDWQRDFKSGYRWSARTWYMDIEYGVLPGVDVKVPWELARMQHLVMLARAYRVASKETREIFYREFRNEILDFIAFNPPRYGVNWRCTMDVGIRVANWLTVYDIFNSYGVAFDSEFEKIFAKSVYDHAKHIINNLEYSPHLRSNHYLSDIAGLVFASMHLNSTDEINTCLAFGIQELVSEMEHEFHEDGSNFEGSTSYHRLSTEIMLYTSLYVTALTSERRESVKRYNNKLHMVKPPLAILCQQEFDLDKVEVFPKWYWDRLKSALEFTVDLLKPNGDIPQFGDNDSGRFLKLNPVFNRLNVNEAKGIYVNLINYNEEVNFYYDENILNHTHLKNIYQSLFTNDICNNNFELCFVSNFKKNLCEPFIKNENYLSKSSNIKVYDINKLTLNKLGEIDYTFSSQNDLLNGLKCYQYKGMGVYIFKSLNLYLAVRCGEIGQKGNGGHCHNDQMAIELSIAGRDLIRDPGTYVYTPLPDRRNLFRSTMIHFTIQNAGQEQNKWVAGKAGLFSLIADSTKAEVLYVAWNEIIMKHNGFKNVVYRHIRIDTDKVTIKDYGNNIMKTEPNRKISNGYGKLLKE